MTDAHADPRRRLPPLFGALLGTPIAWVVAELWLAAYTDAMHVLAAAAGLSAGSMAGVAVGAVISKDTRP
jgi:hypothetical protein